MKQNKIRILKEFLTTQINFLVFYPIYLTIITLFADLFPTPRTSLLLWMSGGLVVFSMYFVRIRTKNFIVMLILHGICFGALMLLLHLFPYGTDGINRIFLGVMGIGFIINSIHLRIDTEDFEDKCINIAFIVSFVAIALFLQHYQNHKEWDFYYTAVAIIILGCYFINYYLTEYLNFLVVNTNSIGVLPEREIFQSGFGLTFLYTAFGVAVLIITSQFAWLNEVLAFCKMILFGILRFIFGLFMNNREESTETITEELNHGPMDYDFGEGETARIWDILFVLTIIFILFLITVGLIALLRKFIIYVAARMRRGVLQRGDLEAFGAVDVREKCEIAKKSRSKGRSRDLLGFLDAKEKIRRIYKKKVAAHKPNPLLENSTAVKKYSPERAAFYTAREMESEMASGAFACVYEKARYSNEACNAQDVKLMKELCR